ncbi:Phosphopentomutase, partial [Aduncisulcus paluster]
VSLEYAMFSLGGMHMVKRVIIFVMDSVGIGALPDAEKFGDVGVNTLGNIAKASETFHIPNLKKLGIGNIDGLEMIGPYDNPIAAYGRSLEVSNEPFQTFPEGFPENIIKEFEEKTGRKVLCNKPYSGTEVIADYGEEHMKTGNVIVYTSADSVFQIAAHEEVVPLDELYKMCEIARKIMMGENQLARIIARPFVGELGNFERTANRRDYS